MFCNRTKEYLSRKGIDFQERDVTSDPAALDELQKLGVMTTPVTLIGSEVIVGYDTQRIDAAIGG